MSLYDGRAFPVPKIHKDTLIKEVERLVKLGVLEQQLALEWASPLSIIPKKNRTIRFLSNFWKVNKRLIRKPFPTPKISMVLQEVKGFTFAMALDLNMDYYTIRLDPNASRICNLIFPWGKYSYKRLPMGIAGSPDIFQSKMLELMEDLEYVQAYLDDPLCISRSSLEENIKKLEEVLRCLCNAGLKVNVETSTFCAFEIEYLGYILTRDDIKAQSNKVEAILAIQPPTNVKELRHFLGMVQYYRNLWAKRSKILAPLTSLVGEGSQIKVTRAKGTKKVPWHWNEVHQRAFKVKFNKALTRTGLDMEEFAHKCWGPNQPYTHINGSIPINGGYKLSEIEVLNVCMLPFLDSPGNHQAFIINISTRLLLGEFCYKVCRPVSHRLITSQQGSVDEYNRIVREQFAQHRIVKHLDAVDKMTCYCSFPSPKILRAMIIKLYWQMMEIRVHAEKKCRKILRPDSNYSPTVQMWYDRIHAYLQLICIKEGKTKNNGNIIRFAVRTNIQDPVNLTREELKDGLRYCQIQKWSSNIERRANGCGTS